MVHEIENNFFFKIYFIIGEFVQLNGKNNYRYAGNNRTKATDRFFEFVWRYFLLYRIEAKCKTR